nr:hypothetical protein [Paraburkholderia sp. PGU19]
MQRGDTAFRPLLRGGATPRNSLDMILADTLTGAKRLTTHSIYWVNHV